MNQIKSPFASKTNWLNIISGIAGILSLPQVNMLVPPQAAPFLLIGNTVLNIVLRNFFTAQPTTQIAANNANPNG